MTPEEARAEIHQQLSESFKDDAEDGFAFQRVVIEFKDDEVKVILKHCDSCPELEISGNLKLDPGDYDKIPEFVENIYEQILLEYNAIQQLEILRPLLPPEIHQQLAAQIGYPYEARRER